MEPDNELPPIHPGQIIKDILPSVGMSEAAAAQTLGVSRQKLHDILAERRPLSGTIYLRLARLFGSSPDFWMRLQTSYDIRTAEHR